MARHRLHRGRAEGDESDPKLGFFAGASDLAAKLATGALTPNALVAPQLIFNQQLDGWLTIAFTLILWFVIVDMTRICVRWARGLPTQSSSETPRVVSSCRPGHGSCDVSLLRALWSWLREVSGDDAYERYLGIMRSIFPARGFPRAGVLHTGIAAQVERRKPVLLRA